MNRLPSISGIGLDQFLLLEISMQHRKRRYRGKNATESCSMSLQFEAINCAGLSASQL